MADETSAMVNALRGMSPEDQAAMQPETFANPLLAPPSHEVISNFFNMQRPDHSSEHVKFPTSNPMTSITDEDMNRGIGVGMAAGPGAIKAYHASPHDFNAFNLGNAGKGEGTSWFGKGIYAAENPQVAKYYHDQFGPEAQTYHLNIDAEPHQFLDWDKPLGKDVINQIVKSPEHVYPIVDYLKAVGKQPKDLTGQDLYTAFQKANGPEWATQQIQQAGMPGIKYLDAGSRMKGEGTSNYTVYDPSLIDILKKEKGFNPGEASPATSGDAFRQAALQARNEFYHNDALPLQSQYLKNAQRDLLEEKRIARGYTTPAFKGGIAHFDKEMNPDFAAYSSTFGDGPKSNFYSTANPELAEMYAGKLGYPGEDWYSSGSNIMPLYLNTSKYPIIDAGGATAPVWIQKAKNLGQREGAPGVTIKNVWDEPDFKKTLPNPQDVHITFPQGLSTVKSRFAKEFDPNSTNMLKGVAGLGAGSVAEMVDALNNKKEKK